jgi:hypothetical protein
MQAVVTVLLQLKPVHFEIWLILREYNSYWSEILGAGRSA